MLAWLIEHWAFVLEGLRRGCISGNRKEVMTQKEKDRATALEILDRAPPSLVLGDTSSSSPIQLSSFTDALLSRHSCTQDSETLDPDSLRQLLEDARCTVLGLHESLQQECEEKLKLIAEQERKVDEAVIEERRRWVDRARALQEELVAGSYGHDGGKMI
ncbi:hypothetical protein M422DRAFT_49094 [Sphaerobolus stellatus SS14]|uniref:Uncharacterized protein n=1 Tax=Sphaerobolus stellatus (strain SS14) TaxID=990650 RepID=A0A0C9UBN5_SPHS4|nr:hypothetical protein M422DRAFT_49094 [Sphaerobolus stellatus SS14]